MARIDKRDLHRLLAIANEWLDREFLSDDSTWNGYRGRVVMIALVQGAALHYLDRRTGVNDFDVLVLFAERAEPWLHGHRFPNRMVAQKDFGHSKFGRHSRRNPHFKGRTVDLLVRAIPDGGGTPTAVVQRYLAASNQGSRRWWKQKAVIALHPPSILGKQIWPPTVSRALHRSVRDARAGH